MNSKRRFILIICLSVALCSTASHVAIGWLKIKAEWGGHKRFGSTNQEATVLLHSSSPGYDGIDWNRVADSIGAGIQSWATPGSSPAEWEIMHARAPDSARVFIALSAYDLNEYFLCDFRADIVPLSQAIQDLKQADADWTFNKRILTQYGIRYIRDLFPTVGRSDGVMVGIRANLRHMAGQDVDAGEVPAFAPAGESTINEKLSDWSEARLQRRLLSLRATIGEPSFDGPKKLALVRLLKRAYDRGPVVIVVIPNAPAYRAAVMPPATMQKFDETLAELQNAFPQALMLRLDQLPALDSNEYFYDFVHLNMHGQKIATERFLADLKRVEEGQRWTRQ